MDNANAVREPPAWPMMRCAVLGEFDPYGRIGSTEGKGKVFGRLIFVVLLALAAPALALEIHYAPFENLERVDTGLLATATETIDVAAYVLSDRPVIDAMIAAAERGVAVRIVLDPSQLAHDDLSRLTPLAGSIRVKPRGPLMHLKAYVIDGRTLRTGSANLSASGLKQQDNDLVVVDEPEAVARFGIAFERVWDRSRPLGE